MQKIINGIALLPEIIKGFHSKKLFMVTDASYPFINIKDQLESLPIEEIVKFSDFTPNPLYEQVCKGIELLNASHCDTILAVGGGSTMDVAKCIKLFCQMEKGKLYLEQEFKDTCINLIAIPTTAGTGSESTRYAVIYYDGKKQSITHDSIIPNVAVLEPKVLKTLPLYQKKCTLMDALCQGIESWWSVNSNDTSKQLSRDAVSTIMKWWQAYIFENTDEAAVQIMRAANLAGQAICITQTTAPHAFSYKITSMYQLPHGHAVAVALPEIWEYMVNNTDKCIDTRGPEYLADNFNYIARIMGYETPSGAITGFRQMLAAMELKNPVSKDRDHELEILSTSVNPVRLKNNPVGIDSTQARKLYSSILK